ncbi:MAG: hypothetical protein LAT65_06830 [Saccharospirillum sp.]|nr:hypothetical protein [Saccharospirillum sp.]
MLEAKLTRQARVLIDSGFQLQSMHSLKELEQWDDAVNSFLQAINQELADGQLKSPRLERYLKQLLELYLSVIQEIARLEDNKAAEAARLHQKRWAITG